MNKNRAIQVINNNIGANLLNLRNTHWSNVVQYGAEEGWWLNVPFYKFENAINLILNDSRDELFNHIVIPANSIENPETIFRNKEGTADIFMPIDGQHRLVDMQSGSSQHDFSIYESKEYRY